MTETTENLFDHRIQNKILQKALKESISALFPITNKGKTLVLKDIILEDNLDDYDFPAQKEAKIKRKSWQIPIYGYFQLLDENGRVINKEQKLKIGNLPKLTNRFTALIDGNEYQTVNQLRRKSGIYSRVKQNGDLEAEFNLAKGKNFKMELDPISQIFSISFANRKYRLWTLLSALGLPDEEIEKIWGKKLLEINKKGALNTEYSELESIYKTVYKKEPKNLPEIIEGLKRYFDSTQIEPSVTKMTLGVEFEKADATAMLAASKKLLNIYKNEDKPDDRDSLLFKRVYAIDDLVKTYFEKQVPIIQNKISRSLGIKNDLKEIISPATFGEPIKKFFTVGDLSSTPAQTNPVEIVNVWRKTTPMGTGGIKSHHSITMETRDVQPTHLGFLDALNTPESSKVGVTVGLASEVRKRGNDLVTPVIDKNNKIHWLDPIQFYNAKIGFPDQYDIINDTVKPLSKEVKAVHKGETVVLPEKEVEYYIRSPRTIFSFPTNLIPFLPNTQANRASTGGRMIGQALALDQREAPLVRVYRDSTSTYEDLLGSYLNPFLDKGEKGVVQSVDENYITIKLDNNKIKKFGLYKNFPLNQDGYLDSSVLVKPGDKVDHTTPLIETNYTKGKTLALGKNLTVAYMPYKGYNFEDGAVITEDAAKKLSHTMLHKVNIYYNPKISILDKSKFTAWFPHIISPDNLKKLDDQGLIKVGETVKPGEVIAAFLVEKQLDEQEAALKKLSKFIFSMYTKNVHTWEEEEPGIVTDINIAGRNIDIYIKSTHPFKEGDKLSGRYGNKYIVTKIIPTAEAPHRENGEPVDIILSPLSVPSRMNIGQILETAAGKIAEKTGKPYIINNFENPNLDAANKVMQEMKKLGVEANETLIDGKTGQKIKTPIFVGKQYIMKLRHIVTKKQGVHNYGVYDIDEQPAGKGSQKVGIMDTYAYLAHGAKSNLYEIANIKGRRNDEYWRDLQFGLPPAKPSRNFIFDKMVAYLKGSGINIDKKGNKLQIFPLTDKDVTSLSKGELKDPGAMLVGKNLASRKGGLFDPDITGGIKGTNWSHINLVEQLPNPMYEDAIIKALDLTENSYNNILNGKENLNGMTGHKAIIKALESIDVNKRIEQLLNELKTAPPTNVNKLNTKIRYMQALKDLKMTPIEAYTINKIPIIPPIFRPAYPLPSGDLVVSDINKHYRDVGLINTQLKETFKILPEKEKQEGIKNLYNSIKAMQGFIDPITYSREKYKGFLQELGKTKTGLIHGKAWAHRQDISGRSTITVEPDLGLNEVGIPKEFAYTMFKPFILRALKESGIKVTEALKHYEDKSPIALQALEAVLKERPVILNRAPSLHKHSVQAFKPVLTEGKSIRLNPLVVKGFNADFDGDSVDLETPLLLKIDGQVVYMTGKQLEKLLKPEDGNYVCVVKNMEAYGYEGWNPIKTVSFHEVLNKKKFRIILYNGYSFIVSEDHSLMSNKQQVKPIDLNINQELDNIIIDNNITKGFRIKSIEEVEYLDRMIDLEVEKEHVFSTAFGVILHNTMSVMVPIEKESIEEAFNMMPSKILFKHGDNSLMPSISKDYLYGLYALSKIEKPKIKKKFANIELAKESGMSWNELFSLNGKDVTIGQYLINEVLPDNLKDYNRILTNKVVDNILTEIGKKYPTYIENVINRWKDLGAMYSYLYGNTISITDFAIDHSYRDNLLKKELPKIETKLKGEEKIKALNDLTLKIQAEQDKTLKDKNNIYEMLNSGAFTKADSVRQILSMPGVLTDLKNNPLPIPVTRSYGEGLDVSSYFNTLYSARKGTVDRSVNTQETGALTKELLSVSRKFLVVMVDCNTEKGLEFDINDKNLLDRTLLFTIKGIGKRNDVVTTEIIMKAKALNLDKLAVRSPLTCEAVDGVCQMCYGLLPNGQFPDIGTNVGILDSEAITERATQLTMQVFHTGGSALAGGGIQAGFPRLEQLLKLPERLSGKATLSEVDGTVSSILKNQTGGYNVLINGKLHIIPAGRKPIIDTGQYVSKGDPISDGIVKPQELAELKSHLDAQKYIVNEASNIYGKDFYKKTFETVVKSISDNAEITYAPEDSGFLRGDVSTISYLDYLNRKRKKEGLELIEYKPFFKSIQTLNVDSDDWLTKVTTNRIKAALTTGASKGQFANIKGKDPIPAYIYAEEFGKNTNPEKGEFY